STLAQEAASGPAESREMMEQQAAQIRRMLAAGGLKPEMRQQLTGCLRTLEAELAAAAPVAQQKPCQQSTSSSSSSSSQIPQHVDSLLDALLGQQASDSCQPLPPPQSMPPPGRQHQQSRVRPEPVFKDLFRWRVNVPDMPEFPQIGCDPRLLAPLRDRFEATKNIQIDGEIRQVVLDRIQPLLILDEQPRALRFKMPPGGRILLRVDSHQPVELRINSCTKVLFNLRPHMVCLGGPFHELIVHGRPFNVQFNDPNPKTITLGHGASGQFSVRLQALLSNGRPVTPSLDICPTIPRSVLRWATDGAFGSPQHLHLPPLNPEVQMQQ
uniref:Galectin n=1 Tax=Macrostomum lignano TaxID=282301 RepID=A0A1I8IQT6_9PLAT